MHAAAIWGWLLFLSLSLRCSYYLRAAIIPGAASIRINTVDAYLYFSSFAWEYNVVQMSCSDWIGMIILNAQGHAWNWEPAWITGVYFHSLPLGIHSLLLPVWVTLGTFSIIVESHQWISSMVIGLETLRKQDTLWTNDSTSFSLFFLFELRLHACSANVAVYNVLLQTETTSVPSFEALM